MRLGVSIDQTVDYLLVLMVQGERELVSEVATPAVASDLWTELRAVLAQRLRTEVDRLWARGWQPIEVVRHIRRTGTPAAHRLLLAAIEWDHRERPPSTLDPRWVAQIASLDLPTSDLEGAVSRAVTGGGWLGAWMVAEAPADDALLVVTLDLLLALLSLPAIEPLIAPPGAAPTWRPRVGPVEVRSADAGAQADPVLVKVRALLAKAESTSFEAEADAFTAKAHELISRHAIDSVLLATDDATDGPSAIRVFIDDPYVEAKSLLLHVVAEAGRCRAVFMDTVAMSTVVGYASDLAAVELLFTSLLVQAQTSMVAAAQSAPPGARARSRGFRSAFLRSYATRIGHRLRAINAAVVAETEAERGASILPILASRQADVDATVGDLFDSVTSRRSRGGVDAAGWASGRMAADHAQLDGGAISSNGGGAT